MICIWSSWCHYHQNGLPFWCRLTQVVLEKGRKMNVTVVYSVQNTKYFYLCRRRRLCFWFGLFVCLSAGLLANLWIDFDEIFFGGVGHGLRTKWYNFGGDPDHASDPGVQSPKSGSSGSAEVCALWAYFLFSYGNWHREMKVGSFFRKTLKRQHRECIEIVLVVKAYHSTQPVHVCFVWFVVSSVQMVYNK